MDRFMFEAGGKGQIIYVPPYWDLKQGTPSQEIVDFAGTQPRREEQNLKLK